jgi:hypothetical protein
LQPRIPTLQPPVNKPKQELPDYINELLGKRKDQVKITTQVIQAAEPLPTSTLTTQGADVGTVQDTIMPLDPQMKQYEWGTLPENFISIQEEIQITKQENTLPQPIDIRKKYTLTRPDTF